MTMQFRKSSGLILVLMLLLSGCGLMGQASAERQRASEVYVRKGVEYMQQGRNDLALADLEHAVELNRRNSEARNALGVLYERIDRISEAKEQYRRAIDLDGNNYSALNNYSRFLCAHGESQEGVRLLQRVLDSKVYNMPWMALANQGVCHKNAGQTEDAAISLRAALEANPDFAPALLELARMSVETQQFMKARAFLQRFATASGHTAETLLLAARTEQALGNLAEVRAYVEQLKSRFADAPEMAQAKALAGTN